MSCECLIIFLDYILLPIGSVCVLLLRLEMANGLCRAGPSPSKEAHACSYSCHVMSTTHFMPCRVMPNFFLLRPDPAHVSCPLMSCPHVSCRGPCHVVSRKKNPLSSFPFFLRTHANLFSYFFQAYVLFWIHVPLFKSNRIKNPKLKSIFKNNKLIIIGECNISH